MCISVPLDLDVRVKATLLGAVFMLVRLDLSNRYSESVYHKSHGQLVEHFTRAGNFTKKLHCRFFFLNIYIIDLLSINAI